MVGVNMSFEVIQKMPGIEEVLAEFPLREELRKQKIYRDNEVKNIIAGRSEKMMLIIGPCSADNEESVLEYCKRLSKIQERVYDKVLLVPRIYTNKPRTTGVGYKGMLSQPDPNEAPNSVEGIKRIRQMHINILEETGLSSADEMLYPENHFYLDDVLSYVAVGARSVENQYHRLTASGIDQGVGMKNPTSGDISVMLNSIYAAQSSHQFVYRGKEIKTTGNPYAHAVMRGAVDSTGRNIPNYHFEDLMRLSENYEATDVENRAVIVDTNHANSMKKHDQQPRIVRDVINSMKSSPHINDLVKGFMIESYLVAGRQEIGDNVFGKSITDPCIGWEETDELIHYIYENI